MQPELMDANPSSPTQKLWAQGGTHVHLDVHAGALFTCHFQQLLHHVQGTPRACILPGPPILPAPGHMQHRVTIIVTKVIQVGVLVLQQPIHQIQPAPEEPVALPLISGHGIAHLHSRGASSKYQHTIVCWGLSDLAR